MVNISVVVIIIGCRKIGRRRNPAGLVTFSVVVLVLHLISTDLIPAIYALPLSGGSYESIVLPIGLPFFPSKVLPRCKKEDVRFFCFLLSSATQDGGWRMEYGIVTSSELFFVVEGVVTYTYMWKMMSNCRTQKTGPPNQG
jgi:hypothetical protein